VLDKKNAVRKTQKQCLTVEPSYNEQKAFQRLNLISRDISSYGSGEHSGILTCVINNDLEHSPYTYEEYLI